MSESEPTITISDDEWELPIENILTGRGFITGKSGSGKSNTASVLIEELLDQNFPVMIVDTDGEYWGLKDTYEILHVGADDECDLQVGPEHGEKLAELALVKNIPIILDVSGYLDDDEADKVVQETAHHLFVKEKKLQKPFLLLVEECHEFIPEQKALTEAGETLVRIGKRGRKRGLGLCGLSQRPADVKKDFITQADIVVWHRFTWKNDTKVVKRVLGSQYADEVTELDDGQAFVTADFKEEDVHTLQVRRKRTFDAGATPSLGDIERPDLKSVSGDLVDELEEISDREEQRRDRISQLEAELEQRNERIGELEAELKDAKDVQELVNRMAEAFGQAEVNNGTTGAEEAVGDVIEERNRLEQKLEQRTEEVEQLQERVDELEEAREELEQLRSINLSEAEEAVTRLAEALEIEIGGNVQKWRQKYQQEREKREEAEANQASSDGEGRDTPSDTPASTIPSEYREFVRHEFVRDAIQNAKDSGATNRYVEGVVRNILEHGGAVTRQQVADDLDINTTHHIGEAMRALENEGIVQLDDTGKSQTADFDIETARTKDEASQIMDNVLG